MITEEFLAREHQRMPENEIGKIVVDAAVPACSRQVSSPRSWPSGLKLGYLLNFGEALMKDGITRTVNRLDEDQ